MMSKPTSEEAEMTPEPDVDLERAVTGVRAIIRACRLLERASGELTTAQYRVLTAVAEGEHRASRIAARLSLGKPTVSFTVDTLVDRGLLVREWSESDQRVSMLRMTIAGETAIRIADAAMTLRLEDLADRAPDRDALLDALVVLGEVIAARLDEIHPPTDDTAGAGGSRGQSIVGT